MADLKTLVSSGDRIASSTMQIGPDSASVFAGRASVIPNVSSTAFAYASCVRRIVPASTFRESPFVGKTSHPPGAPCHTAPSAVR